MPPNTATVSPAPNTRVQRTRSSPSAPRSPLTRRPLGALIITEPEPTLTVALPRRDSRDPMASLASPGLPESASRNGRVFRFRLDVQPLRTTGARVTSMLEWRKLHAQTRTIAGQRSLSRFQPPRRALDGFRDAARDARKVRSTPKHARAADSFVGFGSSLAADALPVRRLQEAIGLCESAVTPQHAPALLVWIGRRRDHGGNSYGVRGSFMCGASAYSSGRSNWRSAIPQPPVPVERHGHSLRLRHSSALRAALRRIDRVAVAEIGPLRLGSAAREPPFHAGA